MGRLALPILGTVCALCLIFGASSAFAATPKLKIDTVTPGYTTVEVSGEVDPKGDQVEWFFETSTDGGENWEFKEPISPPVENGPPQPFANVAVAGLLLETTYKIRLGAFDYTTEELLASPEPSPEFTTKSVAAPSVTLAPITTNTDTTAVLKATIDPNSPGGLDEEGKSLFATEYAFHCSPECPGLAAGTVPAEATGTELEVEAQATGLEPNTGYSVTLFATNRGGEATDGPQSFSTEESKPTVTAGPGSALGDGDFQLAGTVNPHNSAITSCHFEYGATTFYDRTVPCETIPGAANKASFVTASISDLVIGAQYHFRLVATNIAGTTHSADTAFLAQEERCPNEAIREEQGSTYLPECRAYELVSPVFKEGFVPVPTGFIDGGKLAFASNGNFSDNGNGAAGVPGGNTYLAERAGSGWLTRGLAPSGPDYYTNTLVTPFPVAMSTDLGSSLWLMRRSDQTNAVSDLYIRRPDGTFTRIGSALGTALSNHSYSHEASDDLSHIAFGRDTGVYEYVGTSEEQPQLVSVDNAGQSLTTGPGCVAATLSTYEGSFSHVISADGHVVFFTCNNEVGQSQTVYARVEGTTTIGVSASQCTRGSCNGPSPTVFQGANADGTKVYFTTSQQLVNTDTDETNDLYECDIPKAAPAPLGSVNPCPSLHEVSGAAAGADVQGVTRISYDGSRAYFVATGVLASNPGADGTPAVQGDDNLYVWHQEATDPDGETRFVGQLDPADGGGGGNGLWNSDVSGRLAQTTDDGRYLVFGTYARLIDQGPEADTDDARDIYRYDAETGVLKRLSIGADRQGGNEPGANANFTVSVEQPQIPGNHVPRVAMSEDGGSVVFNTSESLAPGDTNGTVDVYLWNEGHVSLVSSGKPSEDQKGQSFNEAPLGSSAQGTVLGMITPSGRDVYFSTTARLVASDVGIDWDIYDARIEGGFDLTQAAQCTGERCRPSAGLPLTPEHSTTHTPGAGNPPKVKLCPKGKVKKHGRCVKKKTSKHRVAKHRHAAKHRRSAKHRSDEQGGGRN